MTIWANGLWATSVWVDGLWAEARAPLAAVSEPSGGWFMRPLKRREAVPQVPVEEAGEQDESSSSAVTEEVAELPAVPMVVAQPIVLDIQEVKRAAVTAVRGDLQELKVKRRRETEMLMLLS